MSGAEPVAIFEKAKELFLHSEFDDFVEIAAATIPKARGGSVDLNRFRAFSKWFSALVTPPPPRASAA